MRFFSPAERKFQLVALGWVGGVPMSTFAAALHLRRTCSRLGRAWRRSSSTKVCPPPCRRRSWKTPPPNLITPTQDKTSKSGQVGRGQGWRGAHIVENRLGHFGNMFWMNLRWKTLLENKNSCWSAGKRHTGLETIQANHPIRNKFKNKFRLRF